MRVAEKVPNGLVFVDGAGVGDVSAEIMREREELARDGIVIINLHTDRFTGEVFGEPEIISRGFIQLTESQDLMAVTRKKILDAVKRSGIKDKLEIEQAAKSYLYSETRRRPIVFVNISRS
jgi:ribonuclease J